MVNNYFKSIPSIVTIALSALALRVALPTTLRAQQASCASVSVLKPFHLDKIPTKDGGGNVVGWLSPIDISILQDCNGSDRFLMVYGYYNGSGTWRGTQTISLTFKAQDGSVLNSISFPLDRGRCIYGGPDIRHVEGPLSGTGHLINDVAVDVSAVSGVQTGC
jgi:hypothetical protein